MIRISCLYKSVWFKIIFRLQILAKTWLLTEQTVTMCYGKCNDTSKLNFKEIN